jgi:lipoprotein-releasing system permease protein
LKGVDATWMKISGLDSFIIEGNPLLERQADYIPAIIGVNMAAVLGINVLNPFSALYLYYPDPAATSAPWSNPGKALNSVLVKPQAVFKVQSDFDSKFVIVPLEAAQSLLGAGDKVSAIAIKPAKGTSEKEVKRQLLHLLGDQVIVENQFEQNRTLWMIMRSEKWAIYVILLFVLLLSSFNMIGALSLLVMEKRKDIAILKSMGATRGQIRGIFISEGILMAFIGGITGVFLGAVVCFSQQFFGWMKLGDGVFIIDSYTVKVLAGDLILVMVTALVIGLIAVWQPAQKAAIQQINMQEE